MSVLLCSCIDVYSIASKTKNVIVNISKNSEKYLKCLDTLFELFSWYNQDRKSLWRKYEIKYSRNS